MSNNIIVKGFNVLNKLITQGYAQLNGGISVKICHLKVRPFIDQRLKVKQFISQSLRAK